jgi:hypothetical protein
MTAASSALSTQPGQGRSSAENTPLPVPLERLGFWSAALAAVFTVLWTVAAVVAAVVSQPASWAGIDAYAASFDSRQMLMLVPVLLLAPTFVVVMACIYAYAAAEAKPWALLGVVFAAMYATIASVTYVLQLTVVRQHLLSRQTAGLDLLVSVNPGSACRRSRSTSTRWAHSIRSHPRASPSGASPSPSRWSSWPRSVTGPHEHERWELEGGYCPAKPCEQARS